MMVSASKLISPSHCFCHIPPRDLRRWARKRVVEGRETMDLLRMARRPRDRAAVCVVAMLDLPDDEVQRLLGPRTQPGCQVLTCRDHVRKWLDHMLQVEKRGLARGGNDG